MRPQYRPAPRVPDLTGRSRRWLLAGSAVAIGGAMVQASFFRAASRAIAASQLPPFYSAAFRGLWFADSGCILGAGIVLLWCALRPEAVSRPLLVALALVVGLNGLGAVPFVIDLGTGVVALVVLLILAAAIYTPPAPRPSMSSAGSLVRPRRKEE